MHRSLELEYKSRYTEVLVKIAISLREHLQELLSDQPRVDRIATRAKNVDRFIRKSAICVDGQPKYSEPLVQIQDQIGARIVVFYNQDVRPIEKVTQKYFREIESRDVIPDSESEFGYFGHHSILVLPSDVIGDDMDRSMVPEFFELQIKTLFQHAWAEAHHDLGYKTDGLPLNADQKRRIAFTSAQAWGADWIFDQLFKERNELVLTNYT